MGRAEHQPTGSWACRRRLARSRQLRRPLCSQSTSVPGSAIVLAELSAFGKHCSCWSLGHNLSASWHRARLDSNPISEGELQDSRPHPLPSFSLLLLPLQWDTSRRTQKCPDKPRTCQGCGSSSIKTLQNRCRAMGDPSPSRIFSTDRAVTRISFTPQW